MTSSFHQAPVKQTQADAAQLSATFDSGGLSFNISVEDLEIEYQFRLSNLQQCICDLLFRNQQLRMAFLELQAIQTEGEYANSRRSTIRN